MTLLHATKLDSIGPQEHSLYYCVGSRHLRHFGSLEHSKAGTGVVVVYVPRKIWLGREQGKDLRNMKNCKEIFLRLKKRVIIFNAFQANVQTSALPRT